jgi:hypothetical protein
MHTCMYASMDVHMGIVMFLEIIHADTSSVDVLGKV